MVARRPPWRPATRPARAAFPSSASASTAACICELRHAVTASASRCLQGALKSAWVAASFTSSVEPGRFQFIRLESIVPPMPTSASIFLRSRSIRAGWRLQPRRARCPRAQLIERLGGEDPALFALARTLAFESVHDYPSGALSWNETASSFVDGLVTGHTAAMPARSRGTLGKDQLRRLRDYVVAHLDEPIGVEALADIAARSPFHFTRVFTRSVGMTPHRYVVHLRLQRALELVREGRSGMAEIAARTGFADQSHLSRWVRRVHGVPLSRLTTWPTECAGFARTVALSS